MRFSVCILIGFLLLSVCAARPESTENKDTEHVCDCTDPSSECKNCPTQPNEQVGKKLTEALKRCNCLTQTRDEESESNRVKRWALVLNFTDKIDECECTDESDEPVLVTHWLKDKNVLSVTVYGTVGSRNDVTHPEDEEPVATYSEDALESDNFSCEAKKAFMLSCNKCWCNARGNGAKYCTRMACNPQVYST